MRHVSLPFSCAFLFCPHSQMKKKGIKFWSFRNPKHLNTEMLPLKKPELARRAFMASLASISALGAGRPFDRARFPSPQRAKGFRVFSRTEGKDAQIEERKSLAVATGELFLGLASRLIRTRRQEVEFFYSGKGRSVVVEDPTREDVVWEQREKDVEAERERRVVTSPGFSFSAAGLLFPYHLGVAQLLLEKGYIKETTPLAGSSAGAIVCAVIASGSTMQEALRATKILADDCRLNGTAFRLGAVLRDVLNNFLPDDAHTRSNGRVRVAITQLFWRPKGLLVDQFDSKEDLINAVFTSSFIPGYLAPRPATIFRNRLCIDGGLTLFMPPTSASETVCVCAFPVNQLGLKGIGISPDCNPENRASPRQLFNWALEPAEDDILDKLFELGYLDADVWASQNPVASIIKDEDDSNGSVSQIIS